MEWNIYQGAYLPEKKLLLIKTHSGEFFIGHTGKDNNSKDCFCADECIAIPYDAIWFWAIITDPVEIEGKIAEHYEVMED